MSAPSSDLRWEVSRPWTAYRRELGLAALWFLVVAVLCIVLGGEFWMLAVLAVAAAYVLGPLFLPVAVRLTESGLERSSRFGVRTFLWSEFRGYTVGRGERAAYLHRRGGWAGRVRGAVTLFLPATAVEKERVLEHLGARLPRLPGGHGRDA